MAFLIGAVIWPRHARGQNQPTPGQPAQGQSGQNDNSIGQVATVQGSATVMRASVAGSALKAADPVYKGDVLATGANASLGVTFDDNTTLNLTANARIVVNDFVYRQSGSANTAVFDIAVGTVAFVAGEVAKTGDMEITTPTAVLGIRGTTGIVDVPSNVNAGGQAKIKLYADSDGRVGHINVFDRQGARLGALTQRSSAFAIQRGAGGRFQATPFRIPTQEQARDRGVVQRLFRSHAIGRQLINRRQQLRGRGQRPNIQQPGKPNQQNRNLTPDQSPRNERRRGRLRERLRNLNPFAPRRNQDSR
jgi:hypothetical protein